ncbi:MAG: efflux RND transporter periplasmic adaptor subunit [Gammaproteobacteria bacterium]|nr:efflux RND transporter periplasmic adaptor subunit [Gammaproteobacteria bacterium]
MAAPEFVLAQAGGGQVLPPALVQVDTAQQTEMAPTVWVPGTIVSRDDARVAAEVSGRLVTVVDVGTWVTDDEALAKIDDTEIAIEQIEAEAVVLREKARRKFAEQEWRRLKGLADKGLVTKNRLDQARSLLEASRGEWRVANARLSMVKDRLTRTIIKAPFSGVVAERYRRVGERVAAGDEVVRLVSPDSLEAQVFVPPATLSHVRLGTAVTVLSNPLKISATVRSVVPIGDDRSRLYEVRLTLPGTTNWPAGTSVRVAVPTATPKTVTAVPRDALVLRQEGVMVFRLTADNVAEGVPVQTGVASGPWIEVTGAIQPGDRVITRGGERIRPGQSVTIMRGVGPQS